MDWLTDPNIWVALTTLTVLETILGIDNVIFIAILAGKLPAHQQPRARGIGLTVAMVVRVGLLFAIAWLMRLVDPLFTLFSHEFNGRDLILLAGGLFLLAKATSEIHDKLEGDTGEATTGARASFAIVLLQIAVLDIVFSLDSVITAVGMADDVGVMVAAIIISSIVMIVSAGMLSDFVDRHPTVKMLALSFLLLIGMSLVAEALGQHFPKGYIYFAMGFSVFVETLNLRVKRRKKVAPVKLHQRYSSEPK